MKFNDMTMPKIVFKIFFPLCGENIAVLSIKVVRVDRKNSDVCQKCHLAKGQDHSNDGCFGH